MQELYNEYQFISVVINYIVTNMIISKTRLNINANKQKRVGVFRESIIGISTIPR